MLAKGYQATLERIERDYASLITRGEENIARLQEKRKGASDSVMVELDDQIRRCERIVQSMERGLAVVQAQRRMLL